MMSYLRKVGAGLNVAVLVLGALLATDAMTRTIHHLGEEPSGFSLRRGIPSVVLLALTLVYAWILRRKGFVLVSALSYVVSYLALGLYLNYAIGSITKNYAPATEWEAAAAQARDLSLMVILTAGAAWAAWRSSRITAR